jgi:hypothetical protein
MQPVALTSCASCIPCDCKALSLNSCFTQNKVAIGGNVFATVQKLFVNFLILLQIKSKHVQIALMEKTEILQKKYDDVKTILL